MGKEKVLQSIKKAEQAAEQTLSNAQSESSRILSDARKDAADLVAKAPWNLEPGSRAPRMCEISLGLIPIHDITPGLDHTGINRAPVYKVGSSRNDTGDVWHDKASFDKLTSKIVLDTTKALNNEIKED